MKFNIDQELQKAEELKFPDWQKAMSKETALNVYVPLSVEYFTNKSAGLPIKTTPESDLEVFKSMFYSRFEYLRDEELPKVLDLNDTAAVADFYRFRCKLLGFEQDWITDDLSSDDILNQFRDYFWDKYRNYLLNPATGQYMFDSQAYHSDVFPAFMLGSGGWLAIEPAYRYGIDLVGIYRKTEDTDPISLWSYRDEGYLYQKWRDILFANEIKATGENAEILVLGGGGLPEIRHTGYMEECADIMKTQKFYVCDPDDSIVPEFLFQNCNQELFKNIDYRKTDLKTMLGVMMQEKRQFDMIYTKGLMSFVLDQMPDIIGAAMQMLKPGGKICFDLQIKHFAMMRNACVFQWGGGDSSFRIELKPLEELQQVVYAAVDALNIPRENVDMSNIMHDATAGDPFGVTVIIKK